MVGLFAYNAVHVVYRILGLVAEIHIKPKPFMKIAALQIRNISVIELRLKCLTERYENG